MSHAPQDTHQPIPGVKNTIAVSSGKGGVGKSTLSVNLAIALARGGLQVGLMDADIYGPNIPGMLGLSGPAGMAGDGKSLVPLQGRGLHVISMGMLMDRGAPVIWRGPMLAKMMDQFLFGVTWPRLDVLILDLPPGTGDVQISLTQKIRLTGAIIVTTPSQLALADVRRGVEMFHQTQVPILGLVENMSTFVCHKCGQATPIFGEQGTQQLAAELDLPILARIPLDTGLRAAADAGEVFMDAAPDSPATAGIQALATAVREQLNPTV